MKKTASVFILLLLLPVAAVWAEETAPVTECKLRVTRESKITVTGVDTSRMSIAEAQDLLARTDLSLNLSGGEGDIRSATITCPLKDAELAITITRPTR